MGVAELDMTGLTLEGGRSNLPAQYAVALLEVYGQATTVAHLAAWVDENIVKTSVGLVATQRGDHKGDAVSDKHKTAVFSLQKEVQSLDLMLASSIYSDIEKAGFGMRLSSSSIKQWNVCVGVYAQDVVVLVAACLASKLIDTAQKVAAALPVWKPYVTETAYNPECEGLLSDAKTLKNTHGIMTNLHNFARDVTQVCTQMGITPVSTHPLTEGAMGFAKKTLVACRETSGVLAGIRILREARSKEPAKKKELCTQAIKTLEDSSAPAMLISTLQAFLI